MLQNFARLSSFFRIQIRVSQLIWVIPGQSKHPHSHIVQAAKLFDMHCDTIDRLLGQKDQGNPGALRKNEVHIRTGAIKSLFRSSSCL